MADAHHLTNLSANPAVGQFREGDTVRVAFRIREGDRVRVQSFQGVVIRKGGAGPAESFTVRRVAFDVGIERTFPVRSPLIESVTVVRQGRVRRAKLYYLRGLSGRAARVRERRGGAALLLREATAAEPGTEVTQAPGAEGVPGETAPQSQAPEPARAESTSDDPAAARVEGTAPRRESS